MGGLSSQDPDRAPILGLVRPPGMTVFILDPCQTEELSVRLSDTVAPILGPLSTSCWICQARSPRPACRQESFHQPRHSPAFHVPPSARPQVGQRVPLARPSHHEGAHRRGSSIHGGVSPWSLVLPFPPCLSGTGQQDELSLSTLWSLCVGMGRMVPFAKEHQDRQVFASIFLLAVTFR